MGKRGSPQRRNDAYKWLIWRDGHMCRLCKRLPASPNVWEFEVDHVDGDETNWNPDNLRLLCRTCNAMRNARDSAVHEGVKSVGVPAAEALKSDVNYKAGSPEMQVNGAVEIPCMRSIVERVRREQYVDYKDAVDAAAYAWGPSPETVKRWLGKYTSSVGPLTKERDSLNNEILRLRQQPGDPRQMYLDGSYQTEMGIDNGNAKS